MNFTMRLFLLCLAASTVSAAYQGFFGKPTSHVESNEKTRRIEQQLRKNLGEESTKNIPNPGPRGRKADASEGTTGGERTLKKHYGGYSYGYYEPYYEPYYYEPEPYYYKEPYYESYYPQKKNKYPYRPYPKYYESSSKKSKKGSKKWGGKMGGVKMSGKWQGMWQGKWKNKWNMHRPAPKTDDHILDMVFQDDTVFTDDILEDEDCELFVAAEAFAFSGYSANVTIEGAGGIGTQYIWEPAYMQDRFTTDLIDAIFSGYCIMTSSVDAYCHFVIVNNVGDQITMAGTLTTPTSSTESAGVIALTGGTGAMAGVIGEAEFYANPIGRNVFELASRFDVDVILGVIVCKPQALPVY